MRVVVLTPAPDFWEAWDWAYDIEAAALEAAGLSVEPRPWTEVGDLTGRENIYLNGAILGISKAEIKRKFDDIVAFAELEEFIDTPIKRYSSGMSVRLGFAIATSVDADILIVDEVLAVGSGVSAQVF